MPSAGAQSICDRYASMDGSDTAEGTDSAPFRTAQKLVDSLGPGQTGCLRSGTYTEPDNDGSLTISKGGAPGQSIVLRSSPGEQATFSGRLYVTDSANFVTVSDLVLDGSAAPVDPTSSVPVPNNLLPSPTVNGDYTQWLNNDITNNHKGSSCFDLGQQGWGTAVGTLIQNNRIHDCGTPLDSTDPHGHGIYVNTAQDTRIIGNQIYDNAARGIQLYPNAQGSLVRSNVIDGNGTGVMFSGADGYASSSNTVTNNVITNSRRYNSEHWWPSGNQIGQGNVLENNCVYGGTHGDNGYGGILWPPEGYDATNNVYQDPIYANREAKDFSLQDNSPCKAVLGGTPVAQNAATLTLAASPTLVYYNARTTLTGKLSDAASNIPLPNEAVTVWKSTDNDTTWSQEGQTTTDSSGNYTYTTSPLQRNTSYRTHFAGDVSYGGATSPDAAVSAQAYPWQGAQAYPRQGGHHRKHGAHHRKRHR